jgi:hypothetical protein
MQQKQIVTIQPLNLRTHQVTHYQRIIDILSRFSFFVDGSEMGTGKTYVTAAVAITLKLPTIVVCPVAARKIWRDVFQTHGVTTYNLPETGGIISYESLRSKKGYQPKHGLLTRDDTGTTPIFYPTTLFVQLVQAGVLVIFDECQKLKNNGNQNAAAKALIRQVYAIGGKSRIALLSGSVLDKEVHAINFLRMVGFITSRNLYSKVRGEIRLEGIQDLYNWARRINAQATDTFISSNLSPNNSREAVTHVFDLFTSVIKPGVMSIMPRPNYNGMKDIKNGHYLLEREDDIDYQRGICQLADAVRYDPYRELVFQTKDSMGAVTLALITIQTAKMRCIARLSREELAKEPVNESAERLFPKVILYADYYEVIDFLLQELQQYNPLELTGRLSEGVRNTNISLFQEHNSSYRLMIANPLVGGVAVSLHDTDGHFPRIMYIMPGYRINEIHQATGRIFRDGLIGTAKIRFVYGLSSSSLKETNILTAMARKGETMKRVHHEQSEYGMKFANEYEDEYEIDPSTISTGPIINPFHTRLENQYQRMIEQAIGQMQNGSIIIPQQSSI